MWQYTRIFDHFICTGTTYEKAYIKLSNTFTHLYIVLSLFINKKVNCLIVVQKKSKLYYVKKIILLTHENFKYLYGYSFPSYTK